MKFVFALCLVATTGLAAQSPTKVSSTIDQVTIFLQGAQIVRTAKVKLKAGENEVVFGGLSANIMSGTLHYSVEGAAEVLSSRERLSFIEPTTPVGKLKVWQDSLNDIQLQVAYESALQVALNEERALLLANRQIGSDKTGVTAEVLGAMADFYRQRLTDIGRKLADLGVTMTQLNLTGNRLQRQINEHSAANNQAKSEVTLILAANQAVEVDVTLHYAVANAGWAPTYDLVASAPGAPVDLKYRAKAVNNTGLDWNNVKITLSTGNARENAAKPQLDKWVLNAVQFDYRRKTASPQAQNTLSYEMSNSRAMAGNAWGDQQLQYIEISDVGAQFEIAGRHNLPSSDKPNNLQVSEHQLSAQFEHYAAPKVKNGAFLLARVVGWENLNLVEGPVHVYSGKSYIGQSHLYSTGLLDTLDISLGRDLNVPIKRELVNDQSSRSFIGSNIKRNFTYSITAKNNHQETIQLVLQDQIPVSNMQDVKVTMTESSGAELDPETGILTWRIKLEPGQTANRRFGFEVRYPKDKHVSFKNSVTVPALRF